MKVPVVPASFLVSCVLAAAAGCHDGPTVVCPAILYMASTNPDTTTIKVGAATIAIAGSTWGGCEAGPPPPDFIWKNSDSGVVRVTALDSIHARIQGLRPGRAVVTPIYQHDLTRASPPSVTVTVVP
jgi:hypothetical protein